MEPIRYVDLLIERYSSGGFALRMVGQSRRAADCARQAAVAVHGDDADLRWRLEDRRARLRPEGAQRFPAGRHRDDADSRISSSTTAITTMKTPIATSTASSRSTGCARWPRGEIGGVAPRLWSGFMGRIYKRREVIEQAAPDFARALKEDGVDILVAVPA